MDKVTGVESCSKSIFFNVSPEQALIKLQGLKVVGKGKSIFFNAKFVLLDKNTIDK